jgi:phage terminase small subunit
MSISRKTPSDSAHGRMELASWQAYCQTAEPAKREGLPALTNPELKRWRRHLLSRTQWKESEMVALQRLVRQESKVEKLQAQLEEEGYTFVDDKNNIKPHPLATICSTAQSVLLQMYRGCGLTAASPTDAAVAHKPTGPRQTRNKQPENPAEGLVKLPGASNLLHLP